MYPLEEGKKYWKEGIGLRTERFLKEGWILRCKKPFDG
jgi:hypothetical protein